MRRTLVRHQEMSNSFSLTFTALQGLGAYKKNNMKFINYLENITGIDVYGMTSFLIFFTFFIVMSLWALCADKKMIDELSNIPLDGDKKQQQ